jgi:hypothetical protein
MQYFYSPFYGVDGLCTVDLLLRSVYSSTLSQRHSYTPTPTFHSPQTSVSIIVACRTKKEAII